MPNLTAAHHPLCLPSGEGSHSLCVAQCQHVELSIRQSLDENSFCTVETALHRPLSTMVGTRE